MRPHLLSSAGARIACPLIALGAVALTGAGATWAFMDAQAERIEAIARASNGPILTEQLRAGTYAVVMESRGLYLAANPAQARTFAANLNGHLARVEAGWRSLKTFLPDEDRPRAAAMDEAMDDFVRMRRDLARVGVEQGAQAASQLGNNDANRAVREAFSRNLDRLADSTAAHVEHLKAGTLAAGRHLSVVLLAATSVAVIAVLTLALWLTRRTMVQPLRRLSGALLDMMGGNLDGILLPPPGPGEIGDIARAADAFLTALRRNRDLEAATAAAAQTEREKQRLAFEAFTRDFSASVGGVITALSEAASEMTRCAEDMSTTIDETRASANTTAAGAAQSVQDLVSVVAAAEQLTASISEIAHQIADAAQTAQDAVGEAERTGGLVQTLTGAAARIGDVVQTIASIAGQTNLLALNATIEAARAGEAGKGFAVVATEVKGLAARTAEATGQVDAQISGIRGATDDAAAGVRAVSDGIDRMNRVTAAIAAAIGQQSAVTREIAAAVQNVSSRTEAASAAMANVAAAAGHAARSSQTVRGKAHEVDDVARTLRREVDLFLSVMREKNANSRRFERHPGRGARGTLVHDGRRITVQIEDISLGGAALRCDLTVPKNTAVQLELPGSDAALTGRTVDAGPGRLSVAFVLDPAVIDRIEAVLETIARLPPPALAA